MIQEWAAWSKGSDPDAITTPPDLFAVTYLNDFNDVPLFLQAADLLISAG